MTRFVRLLVWTVAVLGLLLVATWAVLLSPLEATQDGAHDCVESQGGTCAVDEDEWFSVTVPGQASVGLIVYPGARVVPEAYAPMAELVADEGISVFIVRMPLNFAIFDWEAADVVIDAHPEIQNWVIAGHSLGGAMAARYAGQDDRIDGLVLWAAYPEASLDLSDSDLVAGSISATEDGLATQDEIEASRPRLPSDTVFTVIDGGNHAQFGAYGPQRGDGVATISAMEQWSQVAAATSDVVWRVATENRAVVPGSQASDNPG